MLNNNEKISIIMNCYNGEPFIQEALNSIVNQTYTNWELIFWDNNSSDKSIEIVKNFKNNKFKIFEAVKHKVLFEARNMAIEKCSGKFITFLDTDDVWLPSKLEKQINLLNQNRGKIVYTNLFIKKNTQVLFSKKNLPQGKITKDILNKYPIFLSSVMIDSSIFINKKFKFNHFETMGDFDFFYRLSKEFNFLAINEPLIIYRDHENMTTKKKFELHINEMENWLLNKKSEISDQEFNYQYQKIIYNKCSINLTKKEFGYFFKNLKSLKNKVLIFKLLLKYFLNKFQI